jgi:hypothetical protein
VLIHFPNILLIAGSGRNTGKTSFACNVIKSLSPDHLVTGIKVTHHHENDSGLIINQENDYTGSKDTSRMLLAGAEKAFYCQSDLSSLSMLIPFLETESAGNRPVVCESGALHSIIQPGLFIMISHSDPYFIKPSSLPLFDLADLILYSNETSICFQSERVRFSNGKWFVDKPVGRV